MRPRHCLLIGLCALPLTFDAAYAGTREDVLAATQRCGSMADNRTWLDCFYGSAQPMRAELGLPPAPVTQTQLVPPPSLSDRAALAGPPPEKDDGGMFGNMFGSDKPVVANVRMVSYAFNADGLFTVKLEGGGIWQQHTGADSSMAHWDKPASSYVVTITPGVLGSYDLRIQGMAGYFKVSPVR